MKIANSLLLRRVTLALVFCFAMNSWAGGKSPAETRKHGYYEYSNEGAACIRPEIRENLEVPINFPWKQDQLQTPSCYLHAAHFQIEYFQRLFSRHTTHFHLPDLAGNACNGRLHEIGTGEHPASVLLSARGKKVRHAFKKDFHIQDVMQLDSTISRTDLRNQAGIEQCCKQIQSFLPSDQQKTAQEISEVVNRCIKDSGDRDQNKLTHRILSELIQAEREEILPYEVHVFEPDQQFNEEVKKLFESGSVSENVAKENLLYARMRDLLEPSSKTDRGHSYPFILNFCVEGKGDECEDYHATSIVGARTLCCGPSTSRVCTQELKVVNSYGGLLDGWFKAEPILKSYYKHHMVAAISYLRPCGDNERKIHGKCTPYIKGPYPAVYLVSDNQGEALGEYLKENPDQIDLKGVDIQATPLYLAAEKGYTNLVQILLNLKATVNLAGGPNGDYPLSIASAEGHLDVVNLLIGAKADVNLAGGFNGNTPLGLASMWGRLRVATALIEAKADVNLPNQQGFPPLLFAAGNRHKEVTEVLLKAGAQEARSLHWAAIEENLVFLQILLSAGANVNKQDQAGWTSLDYAVAEGHARSVKNLIEAGAEVNHEHINRTTPFQLAAKQGHTKVMKLLFEAGADPFQTVNLQLLSPGKQKEVKSLIDEFQKRNSRLHKRSGSADLAVELSPIKQWPGAPSGH